MQDESTSMEVEGANGATTLASSSDASAASAMSATPMSSLVSPPVSGSDVQRVSVTETAQQLEGLAPRGDAANELSVKPGQGTASRLEAAPRAEEDESPSEPPPAKAAVRKGQDKKHTNNLRKLRIERMMSKAELARRANLSVLTIDRIEKGFGCRMDSKRKILEALGLSLADRIRVFGEEE